VPVCASCHKIMIPLLLTGEFDSSEMARWGVAIDLSAPGVDGTAVPASPICESRARPLRRFRHDNRGAVATGAGLARGGAPICLVRAIVRDAGKNDYAFIAGRESKSPPFQMKVKKVHLIR
jgi:hypothetical protein